MDKENNYESVFVAAKDEKCLFTEQFESWGKDPWNDSMPQYFDRLNEIDDDRSFVILATSILEFQIKKFLEAFIPKSKILFDRNSSLAMNIDLIKAFNLIPSQFPKMLDCLKNIRNDFAHNLHIDGFMDAKKSTKLPIHIKELKKLWNKYSNDMCYWDEDKPLRLMFKDIWHVSLEGLWVYETNIKLFRQEIEKPEFIEGLSELANKLKNEREENDKKLVRKKLPRN